MLGLAELCLLCRLPVKYEQPDAPTLIWGVSLSPCLSCANNCSLGKEGVHAPAVAVRDERGKSLYRVLFVPDDFSSLELTYTAFIIIEVEIILTAPLLVFAWKEWVCG